jgi:hypothetical protein
MLLTITRKRETSVTFTGEELDFTGEDLPFTGEERSHDHGQR